MTKEQNSEVWKEYRYDNKKPYEVFVNLYPTLCDCLCDIHEI